MLKNQNISSEIKNIKNKWNSLQPIIQKESVNKLINLLLKDSNSFTNYYSLLLEGITHESIFISELCIKGVFI